MRRLGWPKLTFVVPIVKQLVGKRFTEDKRSRQTIMTASRKSTVGWGWVSDRKNESFIAQVPQNNITKSI